MLLGLCLLAPSLVLASKVVEPDQLVRDTMQTVLDSIKTDKAAFQQDQEKLFAFVDQTVLPHFDFSTMSRWVMGKHWRKFSDTQKQQFEAEFRRLLVKTYGLALLEYNDQTINVFPPEVSSSGKTTVVKTEIIQAGATPVKIDYRLHRHDDAGWKVFDISIEGISLVANYRTSFSNQVRQSGVDGLLEFLVQKNNG